MFLNQNDFTLLEFALRNAGKRQHNDEQRQRIERDQRRHRKPGWDGHRHQNR